MGREAHDGCRCRLRSRPADCHAGPEVMIDETKLRLFAAAVGVLFGLGGVLALFVGITIALAEVMGLAAAALTVAGIGLLLAAICLFFCLQPFRSMEEEVG